jgi:SPP1 gp7 family putative phage head morphogenesis protein
VKICNPQTIRVSARFDMKNPLAIRAARDNAARMVVEITSETRKALATVIQRALREGISPVRAAKMIRPMIGLTSKQAQAVMNAQSSWEASGVSSEIAAKRAEFYANKLLRQRSLTIARTEILTASNEGQLAAWHQAAERGLIDPTTTRRKWIATEDERTCPICGKQLDGKIAELSGLFPGGKKLPPAHPRCRCTTALVFIASKK